MRGTAIHPPGSPPSAWPGRLRLLLAVAALGAGGTAALLLLGPRSRGVADDVPPDPRLTYDTPYRNVHPDVGYVGDAACAACHPGIDRTYHSHPMGRSAGPPDPGGPPLRFTAFGHVEYRVDAEGGRVTHTEVVHGPAGALATTSAEVVAAIGSGTRGKSYLCARDGSLWQSGASWFAAKPGWDVSPSFWAGRHARRAAVPECLFCHVNRVEPIAGTQNRYREPVFQGQLAIGCERCHGPGALHVAERAAGGAPGGAADTSIVNPRRLPPDLREDVCRQCHLQGEYRLVRRGRGAFDFRPGLPLDLFVTTYVRHPDVTDYHKAVGQVEQTAISRCAAGGGGRFGCTSCHDPHSTPAPAERADFYRRKCQTCHEDRGCTLPSADRQARGDDCTACHMPRANSSNVAHTAITDHRIRRRPAAGGAPKGVVPPGELPLTTLSSPARWPDDEERARDLAVALARQPQLPPPLARQVADRLQAVTARHPGDVEGWEELAAMRMVLRQPAEALAAAEAAVAARPDRERALARAAEVALGAGRADRAREFAAQAVIANPGDPENRLRLSRALILGGLFADAEAELQTLLAATPNHPWARAALAVCWYKQGRVPEALAELARGASINPAEAPEIRNWFSGQMR